MQFLIDFAAEDSEFRTLLERAQQFPTVQGVLLDLDRFWLRAWVHRQLSGGRWPDDFYFEGFYGGPDYRWPWNSLRGDLGIVWPEPLRLSDIEVGKPDAGLYRHKHLGLPPRSPIQAKV